MKDSKQPSLARLWVEAVSDRLPAQSPPLRLPSGRIVSDPNVFVKGCAQVKQYVSGEHWKQDMNDLYALGAFFGLLEGEWSGRRATVCQKGQDTPYRPIPPKGKKAKVRVDSEEDFFDHDDAPINEEGF